MQFPLHIELSRSRTLLFLTVLLHFLAGVCLFWLPWPAVFRYLVLASLAVSLWWHTLRPSRVVGLRLGERGELGLLMRAGDYLSVSVRPDTTVFSQLVVLRVRYGAPPRTLDLVLFTDSMPVAHFRLLRIWLRWLTAPSGQADNDV